MAVSLSDADFGVLQWGVDAIVDKIAALNLSLVVETDFSRLIEFLRSIKAPLVNPTFDPRQSDLSARSFWLRIIDQDGQTVASHAQKVFATGDFYDLLISGELWRSGGLKLEANQQPLEVIEFSPVKLAGNVAHAGSLWVNPRYRKLGLSSYLPYFSRALCCRNYSVDFFTCLVLETLVDSPIPMLAYGYPHVFPSFYGWFPPSQRNEERVHICYMSKQELIDQFRQLNSHPLFMVPMSAGSEIQKLDRKVAKLTFVDTDH
ncbi:MAG: hypothetical protein HY057_02780 [Rhodospirillales bacterium]|nr:hypothetical protein [Rhodospirillales bacterium]